MKTKHTPTPWIINPQYAGGIFTSFGERIGECGQANAEHIVKCVNNHDALVEALKASQFHFKNMGYTEGCSDLMDTIKQALEKAGA